MNTYKKAEQGFTLVEIMVALTIGLFLTAGVTNVFVSTNQTNRVQENLSRMQENARFAMQFLTRDIRQAGFDGSVCGNGNVIKNAYNNLDTSAAQYQINNLVAVDGDDDFSVGLDVSPYRPDRIMINRINAFGVGFPLTGDMSNADDSVPVNPASGLPEFGIVVVTDCRLADVFQITNVPGDLNHIAGVPSVPPGDPPGSNGPGNKTASLTTAYGTNASVYFLAPGGTGITSTVYDIQDDGFGIVGLRRNSDQLVANIENMQILYGQDTSGGSVAYVPAGVADMTKVFSVRISLLVRSPDDFLVTPKQPYTFNGVDVSGAAIPDNRIRKVYTSTISFRNELP